MKEYLLLLLSISVLLICCSCSKSNEDLIVGIGDIPDTLVGKIIKIKDDNTVLIQITEERGGYKVDDKVYVHYDKIDIFRDPNISGEYADGENLDPDYKPVIGDEIYLESFPERHYKKIEGYDYRECGGTAIKYVTVDESSESSLKN